MALRLLSLALLTLALARPQLGIETLRDPTEGVAIQIVVDRSTSMGEIMAEEGSPTSRLDVVKGVARQFIVGGASGLPGRPNDLVGLVAFARYPETLCPLTLNHPIWARFLEGIHLVHDRAEDATALGDALAVAAARLAQTEEKHRSRAREREKEAGYRIRGRAIVLFTDGRNNAGKWDPIEAAALAAEWGIRVYVIGIGAGSTTRRIETPLGYHDVPDEPSVDEATLEAMARAAGGRSWLIRTAQELAPVCREIDRMEKDRIMAPGYSAYRELFATFVLTAMLLLLAERLLGETLLRRIP